MSLCLDLDEQRHTTGAARVEGKKVVQQHVPQHVFVPHDSLFLHFDINTIAFVYVEAKSWEDGRCPDR